MKTLLVLFVVGAVIVSARIPQLVERNIYTEKANTESKKWVHPDIISKQGNLKNFNTDELTSEYWLELGKRTVEETSKKTENKKVAKNVIMFLGDGLGVQTITATRSYVNDDGTVLAFEKFPYTGMSKTYCVDRQVADSGCSATAYLCGVKANYETIGVTANVPLGNCTGQNVPEYQVSSIGQWALDAGKAAGIVTTTQITDASPSGVYAHIGNRDWESNVGSCDPSETVDIARQLVRGTTGSKLRVILGGGRREFFDASENDQEGTSGRRTDGLNLIEEWLQQKGESGRYVWNSTDLLTVDPVETEYLFGLFEDKDCKYNLEVTQGNLQHLEPSLTQMTEKAIDVLSTEENGYFLFVEGGRIDHGHHDNFARIALDETAEFSKAIQAAVDKVNLDETLIVVTADHSHAFSIAGYPSRDADILGVAGMAADGLSYYTLSYANGPGYSKHVKQTGGRVDPETLAEDRKDIYHAYPATAPRNSETHGGEDVSVYAIGPWSHLFTGSYEQNVIPHMMAYAACIGNGLKACDQSVQ